VQITKKLLNVANLLRGPRRGRLVRQYFFISVILIGGGLVTSGLVEIYFRYRESWENFRLLQLEVTTAASFKIEQYGQGIVQTMKTVTKSREITEKGFFPEYRFELRKLLVIAPPISEAIAFDITGVERLRVSRIGPRLPNEKAEAPIPEAMQEAKEGRGYFGPVYFARGSEPHMTIAVPIERFVGEVIGVLQAEVNLKYVWEVISSIKVGQAGYTYLVTRSGILIAHPDISLVLQQRNMSHLTQVKAALQPSPAASSLQPVVGRNLQGKKVFSSFAPVPGLNWIVFTEQPAGEVYAPLYASVIRTSSLLLVGFGMALLATLFVARRVIRPLSNLREGVIRIGRGEWDARLELKTGDEFEILAEEFNKMTKTLKDAHTDLEHKVADRTQALVVANQRLADLSRLKSQFLANVNHELRTPLSAVLGYGELLLRKTEGQIDAAQTENIHKLLNTTERLLNLINSLLDLAKIEAGRMEFCAEPIKVPELINDIAGTIAPMLEGRNVDVVREIATGVPTLNTDPEKLRQIILNLLSNAVKFTERGEIKVSALQENGSLKLVVSDTGIGIKKEELENIFEEFHRSNLPGTRKYEGSGLGLAIVKKLVQFLGGDISVESEVGKGSVFTVTLPLKPRIDASS